MAPRLPPPAANDSRRTAPALRIADERLARKFPRIVVADDRPDCIELLRQRIHERERGFIADIRERPALALQCVAGGFVFGLLAVIVPAIVVAGMLS